MLRRAAVARVEGEVDEGAELDEPGLVLRDAVADLHGRVDRGRRALERRKVVQVRDRRRVLHPREELLRGDSERAAHMAAHVAGGRAGRRSAAVLAESAFRTLLPPTIIAAIPETYKKR